MPQKQCKHYYEKTSKTNRKQRSRVLKFGVVAVALIVFLYLANDGYLGVFPLIPMHPKETTLSCDYAGKKLSLNITLYGNINNYYELHDFSKKEEYLKADDLKKFTYINPQDNTFKKMADQIYKLSFSNGLKGNGDQNLELATCFVQNIEYDSAKANQVLKSTGNTADTEQFPYETLYENKGICTDKTYLGSAILREMGYGTGIMIFDKDEHVSLGINVPEGYTSFGTKYAIMELTNTGFAPGSIPAFVQNGKPSPKFNDPKPISENDDPNNVSINTDKEISSPNKVIDVNSGKQYIKIKAVKDTENNIIEAINPPYLTIRA